MTKLQIEPKTIFLQGISLQGKLKLYNPHQSKALSYSLCTLQAQNNLIHNNNYQNFHDRAQITIFPNKGLVLPRCSQTIKLKPKVHSNLDDTFKLKLTYTDKNNYNKIKVKNKQIAEKLEETQNTEFIKVEVGTDFTRLKKQLEEEVHFSSTLGRDTSNISIIQSKNDKSQENENSIVAELQISSQKEIKLFRAFEENESKNKNMSSNILTSSLRKPYPAQLMPPTLSKIPQARLDATQILFLAMIAGIFFALGSNLGKLLFG